MERAKIFFSKISVTAILLFLILVCIQCNRCIEKFDREVELKDYMTKVHGIVDQSACTWIPQIKFIRVIPITLI